MGAVQYTREMLDKDKFLVKCMANSLSKRVAGESGVNLQQHLADYMRIANYFNPDVAMVNDVNNMFVDIMTEGKLGGFKINPYENLLRLVLKKIQSKMFFRRKKKINCFKPKEHNQPCYCAKLMAAKMIESAQEIEKDEVAARMGGLLAVEMEDYNGV